MKLIEFRDNNGQRHCVRAELIESLRLPSDRVHDFGGLTLTTGRVMNFADAETCGQVRVDLELGDIERDPEAWPCSFGHHAHKTRQESVDCVRQRLTRPASIIDSLG